MKTSNNITLVGDINMKNKLTDWIVDNLEEKEITDIGNKIDFNVSGFRKGKVPVPLIKSNLKNKRNLLTTLKLLIDVSKERNELKDKNIDEVKNLISERDKKKFFRQIVFLATSEKEELINLADALIDNKSEVIEKIKSNDLDQEYNKYIVTVRYENGFYNIYPLYKIKDKKFISVDNEKQYPNYGNININPYKIFCEKNYEMDSFLICKFNESNLEENNERTKFKINGDKLIQNNNIYNINNEEIYEIAELVEEEADLSNSIYEDKVIEIKNEPIKNNFYIKDDSYIYGPFTYKSHNMGGGYYIDRSKNNYIVNKYPIKDNKSYLNITELDNQYSGKSYIKIVYFYDKDNLIFDKIDIITDKELLDKLKNTINVKNLPYDKNEIQNIRTYINAIVDNSLSEERKNRIKSLINNTKITESFIENDLLEIIKSFLDDKSTREEIINEILKDNYILGKLQNSKLVISRLENVKKELNDIQYKIKNYKDKNFEISLDYRKSDIKNLTDKEKELKTKIQELSEKLNLYGNINDLINEKEKIDEQVNKSKNRKEFINEENQELVEKNHKLKDKTKEIQESLEKELKNIMDKYADIAFDGLIADEMLKSAAEWNKKRNNKDFEYKIASKESFEEHLNIKSFQHESIIDYVHKNIKKVRNYSKNDIINIMICLAQGFLTIFAGQPGVGKTSLCNIIANSLGLYRKEENYNRYTEISVEKGWTSKRDLIGYYNPLTKSFDKNNGLLFKIFNILNCEYKDQISDFPYYILLDEANLSPMEYYWADFMNICDIDKDDRKINLGEDYIYNIPKTLRFLATINYDHTTEMLSPRLIDRAWIILLDSSDDNNILYDDLSMEINKDIVMFNDIEEYFSNQFTNNKISDQLYNSLDQLYKKFIDNDISISPRIRKIINKYLKAGVNLFEDVSGVSKEFVALDYAVAQKLLPKINGQGEDYQEFLKSIIDIFRSNGMIKCKKILQKIINKGDNNMQYYQFFS